MHALTSLRRFAVVAVVLALAMLCWPHAAVAAPAAAVPASSPFDTATALWGLLGGIVSPPFIAIIQQPHWTARTRSLVTVALSIGIAVLTCALDGSLGHGQTLLATVGTVMLAAQTTYTALWSKVGATQRIESVTSAVRPQAVDAVEAPPPAPRKRAPAKRSTAKSAASKTTPRKR